jgi:arylsulfatase A
MTNKFLFLLFLFTILFCPLLNSQQNLGKPNVIFILADDLGYGDLGCYGQQKIHTPNIDQLAKQGIRFTQFYAGTSVCAPSRASLLTGLHTGHTAIRGNVGMEPEGQFPIPDSAFTIAELFKKAGYATGDFGKWGLGPVGSSGDPIKQGFDEFYGYNCQTLAHDYFPDHLWKNSLMVKLPNTINHQSVYAGDLIQQNALDFIGKHQKEPFFLYLSYTLPHAGLQLPTGDKYFEAYKTAFKEEAIPIKPWDGKGYQPQAYPKAAYAAMVQKLDDYVGQVMLKLKELGIEKNTMIVFTSDNGPHKEGGNIPEFFNSSGGFRGIKRDLYEGGIREPMIISWPMTILQPSVSNQTGAFWDFMPSFAALLHQPIPRTDGISIVPTITGKGNQEQHKYFYWEFHENGGRQAVLMGDWKGVKLNVSNEPNGLIQLFNLKTDPKETNDVSNTHPDIIAQIKKAMLESHVESKDFPLIRRLESQ